MKLLTFELSGQFAHFNNPASNRLRNTFTVIPKTQLLGLIGAIAGLSGYKNNKTYPEFYKELKDIKVYIKEINHQTKTQMVKYNSMNSFLNNRSDSPLPNVIINEQILLNPNYEIGLLLDENNNLHNTIIKNIKNNSPIFPIYLGKNEFFANIQYQSLKNYEINTKKEIKCDSILPLDEIEGESSSNIKVELLPIDFDDEFKYIYRLMAIPQKECIVSLKNPNKCIIADGNVYYKF